jgi:hypothetical protein
MYIHEWIWCVPYVHWVYSDCHCGTHMCHITHCASCPRQQRCWVCASSRWLERATSGVGCATAQQQQVSGLLQFFCLLLCRNTITGRWVVSYICFKAAHRITALQLQLPIAQSSTLWLGLCVSCAVLRTRTLLNFYAAYYANRQAGLTVGIVCWCACSFGSGHQHDELALVSLQLHMLHGMFMLLCMKAWLGAA